MAISSITIAWPSGARSKSQAAVGESHHPPTHGLDVPCGACRRAPSRAATAPSPTARAVCPSLFFLLFPSFFPFPPSSLVHSFPHRPPKRIVAWSVGEANCRPSLHDTYTQQGRPRISSCSCSTALHSPSRPACLPTCSVGRLRLRSTPLAPGPGARPSLPTTDVVSRGYRQRR